MGDPQLRDYKIVGGLEVFADRSFWPNFFSRTVARLQWDPAAIDLSGLPSAPRQQRHARPFDRIGAEVLGLAGDTPVQRRAAARAYVPPAMLELFEVRLPAVAAELAAGRAGLSEGVGLYHMLLEGVVFDAGQHALLDDLEDDVLPGVRTGIERVERDERWHVGFGLRCLIETKPSPELLEDLLARAEDAADVWGDAVPEAVREHSARKVAHRLHVAKLLQTPAAA